MTTVDTDLLIAGGSTAGLATAIYGSLAGFRCTVVDPEAPADKPCGEGLMPSAVELLKEMGVSIPESFPFNGVRYWNRTHESIANFPSGHGKGIRRGALRRSMRDRARQLGVNFVKGKIKTFEIHNDYVQAGDLRGRWLIGADGLHSTINRQLRERGDLPQHSSKSQKRPRYGMRRHYRIKANRPLVEVFWHEHFEAYITPVAKDVINVAFLFEKSRPWEDFVRLVPGLKEKLEEPLDRPRGAGPFAKMPLVKHTERVFCVGDAVGFLDPITGEGNQLAMAAARELVDCLHTGNEAAYPRRWQRLARGYWWLTSALVALAGRPASRKWIVPVSSVFPGLMTMAFRCLRYTLRPVAFMEADRRQKKAQTPLRLRPA